MQIKPKMTLITGVTNTINPIKKVQQNIGMTRVRESLMSLSMRNPFFGI